MKGWMIAKGVYYSTAEEGMDELMGRMGAKRPEAKDDEKSEEELEKEIEEEKKEQERIKEENEKLREEAERRRRENDESL